MNDMFINQFPAMNDMFINQFLRTFHIPAVMCKLHYY
jgi:hypothetical protein